MKAKRAKKATLKAELAFPYEIKKDSALKVAYPVVLFGRNSEQQQSKLQNTKIGLKKSA